MKWSWGMCGFPGTGRSSSRQRSPTASVATRRQNSGAPSFTVWNPNTQHLPGDVITDPLAARSPDDEEVPHRLRATHEARDERKAGGRVAVQDQIAARVRVVEVRRQAASLEHALRVRQRATHLGHVVRVELPQPLGHRPVGLCDRTQLRPFLHAPDCAVRALGTSVTLANGPIAV